MLFDWTQGAENIGGSDAAAQEVMP